MELDKNKKIIIGLLIIILIILIAFCIVGLTGNKETLVINDINIQQDAFGIYKLVGHVTPEKDFDYIEARITFYDNSNTIIGKSSIAWNILHAKAGETLSLGTGVGAVCDGAPSYAVIEFFDNVYSDNPIANATIQFNGNNTNVTANMTSDSGVSSTGSSNNNNDGKKFTQKDLDLAKSEGYAEGYSDSIDDYDYYYDYSSSDSYSDGSSSDPGYSSGGGSSDIGSSSGGDSSGSGSDEGSLY